LIPVLIDLGLMALDHHRIGKQVGMGLMIWEEVVWCQDKERDQVVSKEDLLLQEMYLVLLVPIKRKIQM
tara:strand:- start:761 stop:967 length:207 start_codon:yes stop_codon:yes gene_type:complete